MPRMARRALRDRLTKREGETLSDGVGGTITSGPGAPLDLTEILNLGSRDSRGGAVSGAAHVEAGVPNAGAARSQSIALSDGSRIIFARVGDSGVMADDEASLLADV